MRGTAAPFRRSMVEELETGTFTHSMLRGQTGPAGAFPTVDLKKWAPVAWAYFHQHQGETVYTIKAFGFFSYKIVIGDPVTTVIMQRIFGTDPTG